jgi:hypothetical protein
MKAIIYSSDSGKILRNVDVPESDLYLQTKDNESIILGECNDELCYIHGNKIFEKPVRPSLYHIFDYYSKQWIDPRTHDTQWIVIRKERDQRLQLSDWTQLPDVPLPTKEKWAEYRQALRDITQQPDPFNIVWPEPPQ